MSEQNPANGEVVAPVVDVDAVTVDMASNDGKKTTTPENDTEAKPEEKTQAEKTFTQAELDEILEKRTAKLARQRDKEKTAREGAEQELQRFKPAHQPSGEPQESQFDSTKEYAQAYSKWEHEQLNMSIHAQRAQKAEQSFKERVSDFREEMEDVPDFNYDKLTRLPLSDVAIDAILDSDMRAKLAVHLVNTPDDVERISKLSSSRQASELGKLEAKLSAVPTKKISSAPPPITPVGGKSSVMTSDLYDPNLQNNTDAWIAEYNKKQAAKRGR